MLSISSKMDGECIVSEKRLRSTGNFMQRFFLARDLRAVTQPRLNHDAPLRIELADLAIKIHAIEKPLPRGIGGGDLREPAFEVGPHRHGIDAYGLARQARHEQFRAVILLDRCTKSVRNLEPSLIINFRRRVAPQHPGKSTSLHKNPLE